MNEVTIIENTNIIEANPVNSELFARWISYIGDARSERTPETYTKNIKRFGLWLSENGITQPKREDIIEYVSFLSKDHKPTTVQGYLTSVKLFFQWTEMEGLYKDVAKRIKAPKIDKGFKKDYLTSKQTAKLLNSVDQNKLQGLRDYAMLSLMVTTGLRTISVMNANIEDIRTVGDSAVLFYKGKGHEEKNTYVKLAEPVEEAIRNYLKARGETRGDAPLFASVANKNNGERMTTRSISRVAKSHMIDVGLNSDRLTAHSLRHTAGTLNLLNGGTLEETKNLLDHADINTTLIYVHALDREKNNSEARIAKAIFG